MKETLKVASLDHVIRRHVAQTVDACEGNLSRAARLLGRKRDTLRALLAKPLPTEFLMVEVTK